MTYMLSAVVMVTTSLINQSHVKADICKMFSGDFGYSVAKMFIFVTTVDQHALCGRRNSKGRLESHVHSSIFILCF